MIIHSFIFPHASRSNQLHRLYCVAACFTNNAFVDNREPLHGLMFLRTWAARCTREQAARSTREQAASNRSSAKSKTWSRIHGDWLGLWDLIRLTQRLRSRAPQFVALWCVYKWHVIKNDFRAFGPFYLKNGLSSLLFFLRFSSLRNLVLAWECTYEHTYTRLLHT